MLRFVIVAAVLLVAIHTAASSSTKDFRNRETGFRWKMGGREGDPSPALDPLEPRTLVATILAAAGAALSSAGGVGGGGIYVPIFNLLLRFNTRTAAVLSNFMIFGGMLANMLWSIFQSHPDDSTRPLIDLDAALLMQPGMLLGISMGVFCNVMFPGWLITALLAVTLGFVMVRSCRSGMRCWKDESYLTSSCAAKLLEQPIAEDADAHLVDLEGKQQQEETIAGSSGSSVAKLAALVLVWLFFFEVQILRGSRTSEGYFNLEACGIGYWLITSVQVPATLVFTVWTLCYLRKQRASHDEEDDAETKANRLPVMALLAGILGGLLGIGGGMLINPILLAMGMTPQVTAATCAFMVFFSSSLSVVQYWLMGRIPVAHAFYFSVLSFVFSLVGLLVVQRAVVRSGRSSIIVFLVSTVMGLSAVLLASFGSLDVWRQYQDGEYMGFVSPC